MNKSVPDYLSYKKYTWASSLKCGVRPAWHYTYSILFCYNGFATNNTMFPGVYTKMDLIKRPNDSVYWFMNELGARVVAKTGIPSDRHHLGKLILQSLKDAPDFVSQIDGATNEAETNRSILERSIRCATAFKNIGLKVGDVITLMAPNHLDLAIPFYAALYIGVIISPIDRNLTVSELGDSFKVTKPKIIFCQSEKAPDVQVALNKLDLDSQIVTFDKGDYLLCFSTFLEKYCEHKAVALTFKATDFDPSETIAILGATSGTTGLPKAAAGTHANFAYSIPNIWSISRVFPTPTKIQLLISPIQWLTANVSVMLSVLLRYTRVQTSEETTPDHIYQLINNYRPTYMIASPTMMSALIKFPEQCDLSCFEILQLGGSAVSVELVNEIKKVIPKTDIYNIYGMTELNGIGFQLGNGVPGSTGRPLGSLQYRLIDVETQKDINETNIAGELWLKGPEVFKGYYNNLEASEEAFADDDWLKTGDLFFRDENLNFYFVERLKLLLKYKSYQIAPVEVENVIRRHPGVSDVAVTGVPDTESGDLLVAFVVRRPGSSVIAQEIKDIVKGALSDSKQLRGGVIFIDAVPQTPSSKVHRRKLKELAMIMERE